MDTDEVLTLSPVTGKSNTAESVLEGLKLTFQQSYGLHDPSSLTVLDYLKYKLSEIDNHLLPIHLKSINRHTVTDPHLVTHRLQCIKHVLMSSLYTMNLLSLLDEEVNSLIGHCKEIVKDAHKLCRKLNQRIQRNLFEQNYDKIIHIVEEYIKNYPLCSIAQNAVTMVKKIIPYCDGELLHYMMERCESLQMMTCDYHVITILLLPLIIFHIKVHKQITGALLKGSPDTELTYHYHMSGKYDEEYELLKTNSLIRLQEVAPNYVPQQASQQ